MQKLISIVLPTSNRGKVLHESLPLLADQVKRNSDLVELIVCDNASSDDTVKILSEMRERDPFFTLVHYDKREEDIGASIARAAENGTGEYIHFWSDDDIPSPFMVDAVIATLRNHPDCGCVMLNRLIGSPDGLMPFLPVKSIEVAQRDFTGHEVCFATAEDFIYSSGSHFGFLGVFIVKRVSWHKGMAYYDKTHFGYQFQTPLLCGLKDYKCIFLNYPHLLQRIIDSPRYINYWPLYIYVGYARVCQTVEKAGVIGDWRRMYAKLRFIGSRYSVVKNVMNICVPNKTMYLPYVDEMIANQTSRFSKAIFRLIRAPACVVFIFRFVFWLTMTSAFGRFMRKIARYIWR